MRIAYFADTPRIGGAERYLAVLAEGALAAGHGVRVVSPQPELLDLVPGERRRAGSDAYARAPTMARRAALVAHALPPVARALAGADLVHVNNGGYPGSDLCRAAIGAAAIVRVPRRVLSVHSVPWSREESDPRVQAAVDSALWRGVSAVVGATEAVGDALVSLRGMPRALYRKIPYGVEEPGGADDAPALRAELGPGGAVLVGMVSGTADAEKGHQVLLEALARPGVEARAVFVGASPGDFAQQVESLGLSERVALAGRVPDVGPYLHAIDALVVPSIAYESLPLTILEAMGAGTAVIGSRLSGIPEAVTEGETGHLFDPGDVEALAGLLASASREALAALGGGGRRGYEKRFSRPAMVSATLALYDSL